jgi:hypothetical protein
VIVVHVLCGGCRSLGAVKGALALWSVLELGVKGGTIAEVRWVGGMQETSSKILAGRQRNASICMICVGGI